MTQKENNDKAVSFGDMVATGNLILPTGHLEGEVENPLEDLSCAEMLALMEDFCSYKLGNELTLRKAQKHLKESVFGKFGKCDCWKIFLATKQKKEAGK